MGQRLGRECELDHEPLGSDCSGTLRDRAKQIALDSRRP